MDQLRKRGTVSGEALGKAAGTSRTAVWKHIKDLRKEGYAIASSPRRGYSLIRSPDVLIPEEIEDGLSTHVLGRTIKYYHETPSTQDMAKQIALTGSAEGTVAVAETQTRGRGRMGRAWSSPPGGIYFSMILRPELSPVEAPKIPLVVGVAVAEAIEKAAGLYPKLKWPNDILINGKKIAGILAEMSAETDRVEWIVIGIGINVNTRRAAFPEELKTIATSLRAETGLSLKRVEILQSILFEIENSYENFLTEGFEPIRRRWKELSHMIGANVTVTRGKQRVEGRAVDIDEGGALILQRTGGDLQRITFGDISFGTV
ncbi:MAG: biotin--[acetyl-CoA-carboxylase] ligase [Syntrophales bacterium]|nr:biotin--[acetyl-CoA-carboxylase] ligase [Syntrophales bacterium]MDY0044718.1 biotin--[acetyl-CoA-carboxylase] ligase [Syntrophales bacterium]